MTRRIKPHHLPLIFGGAFAAVTIISGIAAAYFDFKGDSPIHRTVFGNIPDPLKAAFYAILPILLVYGAWMFSNRSGHASPCCASP